MRNEPDDEQGKVRINFYISRKDLDALQAHAARRGTTYSEEIREAIRIHLSNENSKVNPLDLIKELKELDPAVLKALAAVAVGGIGTIALGPLGALGAGLMAKAMVDDNRRKKRVSNEEQVSPSSGESDEE